MSKKESYIALVGFAVKGKAVRAGDECPAYSKEDTKQLLAMRRMAPADSDEAKVVLERIERAEKDRKAAEKAGRLPGTGK